MIFKTKRAAKSCINCTFARWLAAKHYVVKATKDGVFVGWIVKYNYQKVYKDI